MLDQDLRLLDREIKTRGISRLCHLTQSRKLPHILGTLDGIYSNAWLRENRPDLLDANDPQRLDGLPDHISCSVEYPNFWYYRQVKDRERIFKGWIILLIEPDVMLRDNTVFCPRNCGALGGRLTDPRYKGYTGFKRMFEDNVRGAYNRVFTRTEHMPDCCPTDGQAEVMIYRRIEQEKILGMIIPDEKRAKEEISALELVGVLPDVINDLRWIVAPQLFGDFWDGTIRKGIRPSEKILR